MPILVLVVDPRPVVREALTRLLEGEGKFELGRSVPTVEELFVQAPVGRQVVALVGAPALRQADEQALREATRFGKPLRILVLADEYTEETVCRLLMLGCSGY